MKVMADDCVNESFDNVGSSDRNSFDFNKISEHIKLKNIVYDGTRLKWCKGLELLKEFIEPVFCQRGRWWSAGGNSKRFDSTTSEFVVIWYPGKLNTLTFSGSVGEQAKEILVKLYINSHFKSTEMGLSDCIDSDASLTNLNLEIDVLKSRVDSIQVLMNSQCDLTSSGVCELKNEITLLKIDLEEEKFRNMYLEREVKRLQKEIEMMNSSRKGSFNNKSKDNANGETNHPVEAAESFVVEQARILISDTSDTHSINSECCNNGSVGSKEVESDKLIIDKQSTIPVGENVNDKTHTNNINKILRDDELIIDDKSVQNKTYAQVAALHPSPKKVQLINKTSSKSMSNTPQHNNDIEDQFKGIKRYRTKKLFLTGIAEGVNENNIMAYLTKRNIKPTYISVFKSRRQGCVSAKVNIPSSASKAIESENFWPKYVKCKPWRSNRGDQKYSTCV